MAARDEKFLATSNTKLQISFYLIDIDWLFIIFFAIYTFWINFHKKQVIWYEKEEAKHIKKEKISEEDEKEKNTQKRL